jgi:hypothetical protein
MGCGSYYTVVMYRAFEGLAIAFFTIAFDGRAYRPAIPILAIASGAIMQVNKIPEKDHQYTAFKARNIMLKILLIL